MYLDLKNPDVRVSETRVRTNNGTSNRLTLYSEDRALVSEAITSQDFRAFFKPLTKLNATHEEVIHAYLEMTFLRSCDKDPEFMAQFSVHEYQVDYARRTCGNLGFINDGKTTKEGLDFLKYVQEKENLGAQLRMNKLLIVFTAVLALATITLSIVTWLKP
jgi:hypothetical protein